MTGLLKMLVAVAVLAVGTGTADADEGQLKGYMFGDYYSVLSADETEAKLPEKRNVFQLRPGVTGL